MIKPLVSVALRKLGYSIERIPQSGAPQRADPANADSAEQANRPFEYEGAIRFLLKLGISTEDQIRAGSISQPSLDYLGDFFARYFPTDRPLTALHIGNFVGVSLTWAAHCLRGLHPASVVVSIDPNLNHRGVQNPSGAVMKLANYFSLQRNIMVLVGYSLEKTRTNQGLEGVPGVIVSQTFKGEMAFENTLENLRVFCEGKFDVVFIDGCHEGSYVAREIDHAYHLLKIGGLLALDDLTDFWQERAGLKDCYDRVDKDHFAKAGTDGRVGILRKIAPGANPQ